MFNQEKFKHLLDKINWLSDSFKQSEYKNISALEKSLLKEKVLMLFDEIEKMPTSAFKPSQSSVLNQQPIPSGEMSKATGETPTTKSQQPEVRGQQLTANSESPETNSQKPTANSLKSELTKEEKFKKTEQFQKEIAMPKRDIREIIDLNKSFILKAELFNQNNDLYNNFIQEINQTRTEIAAEMVIKTWTEKLKWQTEENKAYELLVRAVEKRFLPLLS